MTRRKTEVAIGESLLPKRPDCQILAIRRCTRKIASRGNTLTHYYRNVVGDIPEFGDELPEHGEFDLARLLRSQPRRRLMASF